MIYISREMDTDSPLQPETICTDSRSVPFVFPYLCNSGLRVSCREPSVARLALAECDSIVVPGKMINNLQCSLQNSSHTRTALVTNLVNSDSILLSIKINSASCSLNFSIMLALNWTNPLLSFARGSNSVVGCVKAKCPAFAVSYRNRSVSRLGAGQV